MSIYILTGVLLLINLSLVCCSNPLTLSLILCLMAGFSSLAISFFSCSWFFYFLFLVYLGGVMVLIMFIISLSPQKTTFKGSNTPYGVALLASGLMATWGELAPNFINFKSQTGTWEMLSTIYSTNNIFTVITIAVLLLLIMCVVVMLVEGHIGSMVKRL